LEFLDFPSIEVEQSGPSKYVYYVTHRDGKLQKENTLDESYLKVFSNVYLAICFVQFSIKLLTGNETTAHVLIKVSM
jgi:hypothetical protein